MIFTKNSKLSFYKNYMCIFKFNMKVFYVNTKTNINVIAEAIAFIDIQE